MKNPRLGWWLAVGLMAWTGCHSIGPKSITRDRFDYSGTLADSWKSMMLLNLVKIRYLDLPIFLEVGQVVSGYSLETSATVGGQISSSGAVQGNTLLLGGAGRFVDRPTITYQPLTGEKFLEAFLKPLQPSKVFSLVAAGYSADFILEMSCDSFNGLRNSPVFVDSKRRADPEFFRVLGLLREIQDASVIGMRVLPSTNDQGATVLFFRGDHVGAETEKKTNELRALLGTPAGESSFRLVGSPLKGGAGELSVGTRSLSQIMTALGMGLEVPAQHVELRLTPPGPELLSDHPPLLRIHSGSAQPDDVYAAVPYQNHWFWIANDDWKSKRTFSSLLFLFTLADTGGSDKLPTITIPAQ